MPSHELHKVLTWHIQTEVAEPLSPYLQETPRAVLPVSIPATVQEELCHLVSVLIAEAAGKSS